MAILNIISPFLLKKYSIFYVRMTNFLIF